MYIYPDNLKSKASMWLWELKDLAVTGIIVLISVFAFAYAKLWFPMVIAGVYAFLTIQVEDTTILKFIRYACAYFLVEQQHYEWRYTANETEEWTVHKGADGDKRTVGLQHPHLPEGRAGLFSDPAEQPVRVVGGEPFRKNLWTHDGIKRHHRNRDDVLKFP